MERKGGGKGRKRKEKKNVQQFEVVIERGHGAVLVQSVVGVDGYGPGTVSAVRLVPTRPYREGHG